ncbi:hypothetical protein [Sorangium sp. So ce145]|uniref:hypothetical protein n=1 Tax=Sorangium sp. So ce145 TaxID=3133285 RepID=UPI003F5E3E1C
MSSSRPSSSSSTTTSTIPDGDTSAAATALRNQLLHLMVERVGAIRKTAAHVFPPPPGDRPGGHERL